MSGCSGNIAVSERKAAALSGRSGNIAVSARKAAACPAAAAFMPLARGKRRRGRLQWQYCR